MKTMIYFLLALVLLASCTGPIEPIEPPKDTPIHRKFDGSTDFKKYALGEWWQSSRHIYQDGVIVHNNEWTPDSNLTVVLFEDGSMAYTYLGVSYGGYSWDVTNGNEFHYNTPNGDHIFTFEAAIKNTITFSDSAIVGKANYQRYVWERY